MAPSGAPPRNRAFRYKSSDLLMQILWAFRSNPLRMAALLGVVSRLRRVKKQGSCLAVACA
ncbi:MAG: hypothetical protein LBK44_00770 [Spirochaetales bacterium]|nr:hypothetical protein [Spirochaetales bacterium]